jgi:DNA helicase-2/ATP-dependent DNA helicase PcrA
MARDEEIEWFASTVCGKPDHISPDECHATIGQRNPLCAEHKCCRIKEKSSEQLAYARAPIDQNTFLKACPGSGKTEVIGLKAAYEFRQWKRRPGGIAVLTFTNNAADVIRQRVCQFVGGGRTGYPHFIGTLSSWLHGYIANPFAHLLTGFEGIAGDRSVRIIDKDCGANFLKGFQTAPYPRSGPIKANEYFWDCEKGDYVFDSASNTLDMVRRQIQFTLEQKEELKAKKKCFLRHGYATHQDVEFICLRLLRKREDLVDRLSRRFPLVIVDECQDLSWTEMEILKCLQARSTKLHLVGDLQQAIYDFRDVAPEKVAAFIAANGFSEMTMSRNYRSCQEIVNTCNAIIDNPSPVRGMCLRRLATPCLFVTYNERTVTSLPRWFETLVGQERLELDESAIVARGWSTVSRLRPSANAGADKYQTRFAMALHLWTRRTKQAMDPALKYIGRFIASRYFPAGGWSSREYYRPQCVTSPVYWRLFLAGILRCASENPVFMDFDQTWTDWAASVRTGLPSILQECQHILTDHPATDSGSLPDFGSCDLRALAGGKNEPVRESLPGILQEEPAVRITTIHSVKGETLQAIMVVSASSKQGDGHWRHWLNSPLLEPARFAYVASSRPQDLLVWAIPEEPKADYGKLEKCGFVQRSMDS